MEGVPALQIPDSVPQIASREVDLSALAAEQAAAVASAAHARACAPSWSATSVTAETKPLPRLSMESTDALDSADPTRAVVPDTPSHRADAGQAWGTLVHGLLEHAMRHKTATREDLRRLGMWLTVEEPQLRVVIEKALDTVEAVSAGEFWSEARASAECLEEVPFAFRDAAAGPVTTGVIDLVYRAGAGWNLLDYKTDVAVGPEAAASYARQIAVYAQAWTLFGGILSARLVDARGRRDGNGN
jgi:ATP-dependent exoDNAse (exonuclease V) beta subunit